MSVSLVSVTYVWRRWRCPVIRACLCTYVCLTLTIQLWAVYSTPRSSDSCWVLSRRRLGTVVCTRQVLPVALYTNCSETWLASNRGLLHMYCVSFYLYKSSVCWKSVQVCMNFLDWYIIFTCRFRNILAVMLSGIFAMSMLLVIMCSFMHLRTSLKL